MIATHAEQRVDIDSFRPEDEAEILAMNFAEYGPRDGFVTPEAFRWRFAENPAGLAEITVAREAATGRLVGFTWTIPVRIRLYGKDYVAVLTANQLIHTEYRNTLVYARMSRRRMQRLQQKSTPFRYNFPTEAIFASVGASEKMSSFLIPLLVRPLDMVRLAKKYFRPSWLGVLLGWGGKAIAPVIFAKRVTFNQSEYPKIEHLVQFDERFNVFWERVQDKYPVMAIRDQAFLAWRFMPVAGRAYHILAAMVGDELVGYTVLRITEEIRGIPIGLVMDLMLEQGPRGKSAGRLLLAEAWGYFREEKVWLAGGLALPHTGEYAAFRGAGYRPLPDRWALRPFRVAFNCFGGDLPKTAQVKEGDLFITIADYEAH